MMCPGRGSSRGCTGFWTTGGNAAGKLNIPPFPLRGGRVFCVWKGFAGRGRSNLCVLNIRPADGGRAYSLPLRGRWPSAARSDEVVPASLHEPAVSSAADRSGHTAFPSGEGGRAQRGRMRSFPHRCTDVPFPSRDARHPARKLSFFFSLFLVICPGCRPDLRRG